MPLCVCCRCKRIASHVSMLADSLAATHPDIVVGRINCEQQEYFCAHVIKISRTPSFKVGWQLSVALVGRQRDSKARHCTEHDISCQMTGGLCGWVSRELVFHDTVLPR